MLKTELIAAARDQWAKTEASITQAAASGKYEEKGPSGWSAGDCYRHLVDVAHKLPEAIEALRAGQQPVLGLGEREGIATFSALNAKMILIEIQTAHGIDWMAFQKLDDAALAAPVTYGSEKAPLGDVIKKLSVDFEAQYVRRALESSGAAVPA